MTVETTEKLAGHAPATMVGGMRVGTSHSKGGSDKEPSPAPTTELEMKENIDIQKTAKVGDLVNARPITIEDAFPTAAMTHMHDKPHPKHDKPHNNPKEHKHQGHLFQPANKSFQ